MNIFAAIKATINSNLKKPLDLTLEEIKTAISENSGGVPKSTRHVVEILGVPYNAETATQVLTTADDPIYSVEGSGRILQIVPATQTSSTRNGTTLLTIDGDIAINNKVNFCGVGSDTSGTYIVDTFFNISAILVYTDIFSAGGGVYAKGSQSFRSNVHTYSDRATGICVPNGIPFKNGFELRLTQAMGSSYENKSGVIIVYELYD